MFNEVRVHGRFAAAAQAGFEAVEFLFPYEHRAEESPAHCAPTASPTCCQSAARRLAAGERGWRRFPGRGRIRAQRRHGPAPTPKALRTPRWHAMAGVLPAGADRAAYRAAYVANLGYAAAEAGAQGIDVLIEPLNPRDVPR